MSIFISIVAYADPVLPLTLRRAIECAQHPETLHFGLVDQFRDGQAPIDAKSVAPAKLTQVRLPMLYARGPCWARALAQTFYQGEDWFFQIDAHTDFEKDWDVRMAAQAQALQPGNGAGAVFSSYPSPFHLENGVPKPAPVTQRALVHVVRQDEQFSQEGHPVLPFEAKPAEVDGAVRGVHVGAGCFFAPGRFAHYFPYDPLFYFHGEEQALALRLFTRGWDIYHVPALPVYHLYHSPADGQVERPMHWDKEVDRQRPQTWWTLEQRSRLRLTELVEGRDLGVYSLGRARSLADYAALSGIDYARRTIEPKAYSVNRNVG